MHLFAKITFLRISSTIFPFDAINYIDSWQVWMAHFTVFLFFIGSAHFEKRMHAHGALVLWPRKNHKTLNDLFPGAR